VTRYIPKYPYSKEALKYYRKALIYFPTDAVLRCKAATTAYILGQEKSLNALQDDVEVHRILAESFLLYATWYTGDRTALAYYRLALDEFQEVIDRDPSDVKALTGYAYTYWSARYWWPETIKKIEDQELTKAERYSRQAVLLTSGKRLSLEPVMARSTLGEVLLSLGRPQDAVHQLEETLKELDSMKNPEKYSSFNEVRWDLAVAYQCTGQKEKAQRLYKQMRENEAGREYKFFSDQKTLNDAHRRVCHLNKKRTNSPIQTAGRS
jgi:tetratricopeptide (TPR) repeat protein